MYIYTSTGFFFWFYLGAKLTCRKQGSPSPQKSKGRPDYLWLATFPESWDSIISSTNSDIYFPMHKWNLRAWFHVFSPKALIFLPALVLQTAIVVADSSSKDILVIGKRIRREEEENILSRKVLSLLCLLSMLFIALLSYRSPSSLLLLQSGKLSQRDKRTCKSQPASVGCARSIPPALCQENNALQA